MNSKRGTGQDAAEPPYVRPHPTNGFGTVVRATPVVTSGNIEQLWTLLGERLPAR
jgi:hypothetical protein